MQLKLTRPLALLAAAAIAIITLTITGRAVQTVTTPNATIVSYSFATAGYGAAIGLASDRSILMMGNCATPGVRASGFATIMRASASPALLEWAGVECDSSSTATALTSGFSSTPGTHILWIDWSHSVQVEVASVSSIRVHSMASGARAGTVTLIW